MSVYVSLRAVTPDDLPTLFEQQLNPEATRMAAFPARDHPTFMAHWARILADKSCATRAVICDGHVAGNIGAWTDAQTGKRLVGYWIGREYWGRGIASTALSQFIEYERSRPLFARVIKHNTASIRVLQKCGFEISHEERFPSPNNGPEEEFILTLA